MAIYIDDEFSEIIGNRTASDRIESFAWITLAQEFRNLQDHSAANSLRSSLADALKRSRGSARKVIEGLNSLAPEHSFAWITGSRRQSHWVERNIDRIYFNDEGEDDELNHRIRTDLLNINEPSFVVPHHLIGRSRTIAAIDYWSLEKATTTNEKIAQINRIKMAWQRHIKVDRHFAWLNDGNTKARRDSFWQWLESRNHRITQNETQFNTHDEVLEFFDHPRFTDAARELFSKSAKKAWDQQQRRDKTKDKRQCNFVLAEKTIFKLEALALKHGLSRTEIIELIIESEAKHEHYISERLQRKNLLLAPLK